jgi:hypothetical protein
MKFPLAVALNLFFLIREVEGMSVQGRGVG